ncbi:pantoate--beta-alanine ligase [Heyndrickxia acidiproducens]|uniref:pantoate--beta-alanine ligase n=1 Tax=Heyndrickxia acidiproducens TaxID=1121084 RepID=UPI00146B2A72|nr:pantoate--beta-alanine ligase [Heyndrickxia acidiproducens]
MKVITTKQEIQKILRTLKKEGKSIGFVPTMGFLHEGHLALAEKARKENDIVWMSIFVNPLQFGPHEDFDRYPRDEAGDRLKAETAGVDYLFIPPVAEMYPHALSATLHVRERTDVLCGHRRPGHFDGVAAVLTKLFHLIQPDRAYFGLKDAQQVAVVEALVRDFDFPVEIVPVAIVREQDGLAKSSRNVYLSEAERKEAPQLYQSLQLAKKAIANGERDPENIISLVSGHLHDHTSGKIDYVELYSYPDLLPLQKLSGRFILAIAVQFKKARLIDNLILTL